MSPFCIARLFWCILPFSSFRVYEYSRTDYRCKRQNFQRGTKAVDFARNNSELPRGRKLFWMSGFKFEWYSFINFKARFKGHEQVHHYFNVYSLECYGGSRDAIKMPSRYPENSINSGRIINNKQWALRINQDSISHGLLTP